MKKLLLLGAIGLLSANLSAQTTESTYYTMGEAVSSAEGLQSGLYYISGYSTRGQGLVQANASGDTFANLRTSTKVLASPDNDKALLWKIDVNEEDHSFTVQSVLTDEYWSLRGATIKVTTSGKAGVLGIVQRTNGTYTGANQGTAADNVLTTGMNDTGHYLLEDITNGFDYESVNDAKGTRFMIKLDGGWIAAKYKDNGEYGTPYAHIIDNCAVSYFGDPQNPNATTTTGQFAFYPAVEVSAASVTFNFGNGLTATASAEVGSVIDSDSEILNTVATEFCPWGISSATVANAVTVSATGENVVNVTPTWALPFEANKPYRVKLNPDGGTHAMVYVDGYGKVRRNTTTAEELNPASIWYFQTAAPVNNKLAFTIHTLATEETKGMHINALSNDKATVQVTDAPSKFFPVKYGNNQETGFSLRADLEVEAYVNEFGGSGGDNNFCVWYNGSQNPGRPLTDAGSILRVEALTDADFDNHRSWTAADGSTKYFESNAKAAAKASKSVADLRTLFATEATGMTYTEACEYLAEYAATKVSKLTATTLFTEAEARAVINAAAAIAENADDFAAALDEAKPKVDAIDVNVEATKKMNGRKVIIRSVNFAGANGSSTKNYITGVATGEKVKTALLSPAAVWTVTVNADNTFVLHNLVKKNYVGGLLAVGEATGDDVKLRLANNGINSMDGNAFAIQHTSHNGTNFLNNNTSGEYLQYVGAGSGNHSSFWTFEFVTAEQEAAWKQAIADKFAREYTFGNLGGQFTSENQDNYVADKAAAEVFAAVEEFDYPEGDRLYNITFTLNPVLRGQLIRIKSNSNKYYALNEDAAAFNEQGSVFYYSPEGHLISLGNGLAASNSLDAGKLSGVTTAEKNSEITSHARVVTFKQAQSTSMGRYEMYYDKDGSNRWVHCDNDGNIDGGDNISTANPGNENYTYAVEPVMKLSVAVDGADHCGSVIAPVALTVPAVDGVQVYEAKTTDKNRLKFERVEIGSKVEAGTPLIIYNEEMSAITVDFPVDYSALTAPATVAEDGAATVENRFGGSHLALLHSEPAAETHVTYVKSTEAPDAENFDGTPVCFDRLREGDVVPAGAVTVKLVQDLEDTTKTPEYTLLDLSGENPGTTMIEEITEGVNAAAEGAVYDLQGRRLAAPVKGINIINGKKVLVK